MALNLVALGVALQNQGGSGGTVFTELTVTENGVYDKPAIIGEPVFEVGEKLTFKSEIVLDVDFPKTIFDEFGPSVFFFDGQYIRPEGGRLSYQDCMLRRAVNLSTGEVVGFFIMLTVIAENCEFLGYSGMGTYIYFDTYTAGTKALEPGWYKDDDGVYTKLDASPYIMLGERTSFGQRNQEYNRALFAMKGVFEGLSSPADGWNKVTVNVPGDIIDVTEFPTSGIDQDKVYRLTTAGESVTEIWNSVSPDIIESLGLSGILEPLTRNDVYIKTLAALDGGDVEVEYELHVVDTLPDVGVPSVPGQSFHVYVVNDESSEAFCFMDGSGWVPGSALDFGSYLGTVDDMADVKEAPEYMAAYYILKETRAGSTSYGIPNEAGTKKIYEHDGDGWIELGEGGSCTTEENDAGGLTYKVKVGDAGGGGLEGFFAVRFYNDDRTTLLYTVYVPSGSSAIYAGETPTSTEDASADFVGFEPSAVNVTTDMDCYAVYEAQITTLDAASWAQISEVSEDGTAENYFAVGDIKMIHIEGTVGTLSVNGDYYVYIIGINHNGGGGITFGTFKATTGGKDLAICDSSYNATISDGTKTFNMNHWGASSYGGWIACDLRYDILGSTDKAPSGYGTQKNTSAVGYDASVTCATNPVANTLMAALPTDLRAVMKPMTIYTDANGNISNTEANVRVSIDYLPLLAEFEVQGKRTYANQYEKNKQAQFAYYVAGNSKYKYNHSSIGSIVKWWMRSADYSGNNYFCTVDTNSSAICNIAMISIGIAPIFKV